MVGFLFVFSGQKPRSISRAHDWLRDAYATAFLTSLRLHTTQSVTLWVFATRPLPRMWAVENPGVPIGGLSGGVACPCVCRRPTSPYGSPLHKARVFDWRSV
jgi:hypothetical protein